MLPGEAVARTARATSLVERNRAIGPVPFVWSFLFGTTQPDGSVTKVQDFYKTFTEHDAAYSSIQQWITPELETLLTEIVAHLSVELGGTELSLGGRFDRFRDVFIADARTVRCPRNPSRTSLATVTITLVTTVISEASSLQRFEYVIGEVSDYGVSSSDHAHFRLAHESGTIHCVIFDFRRATITTDIDNGMQVAVIGDISFYSQDNRCSIEVEEVVPIEADGSQRFYEAIPARLGIAITVFLGIIVMGVVSYLILL